MLSTYLAPYATGSQLKQAAPAPALSPDLLRQMLAQIAAVWAPWLNRRNQALLKIPSYGLTAEGLSGLGDLRTSEGEIREALKNCATAVGGFEVGSAAQMQCWMGVVASNVAQMSALLGQIRGAIQANAQGIIPKGAGATSDAAKQIAALRAAQLQFVATATRVADGIQKILSDPNRGWGVLLAGLQKTTRDAYQMEADLATTAQSAGGSSAELDAIRDQLRKSNALALTKAFLPLVDISLGELKAVREVAQAVSAPLATSAESAAANQVALADTLKRFTNYLDLTSGRDGGILDAILNALFGAEPAKAIAKLVIGIVLIAGAVGGGVALFRHAIAPRHRESA